MHHFDGDVSCDALGPGPPPCFGSGPGIARLPGYVEEPDEAQLVVRCASRSRYRTEEAVLPRGREIELRLVLLPRLCEDIARPENPSGGGAPATTGSSTSMNWSTVMSSGSPPTTT